MGVRGLTLGASSERIRKLGFHLFLNLSLGWGLGSTNIWPAWAATENLNAEEAEVRVQMIQKPEIDFKVDLTSPDVFEVDATLSFVLRKVGLPGSTFIELNGAQIQSIQLNGTDWKEIEIADRYQNHRIRLTLGDLKAQNTLKIHYKRPYQTNGVGLHRFEDPADQQTYLYTHFEPYYAHWFLPCFDQPDLKTIFRAQVVVPKQWTVFHNTLEDSTTAIENSAHRIWKFKPTPRMSTYLLALVAGPFQVWKSSAKLGETTIPLRLAARKSLVRYVDTAEWFSTTRRGLDFFSVFFGYEYPFQKYDQILVPEFDQGAMENTAAVTFNEAYAFRSAPLRNQIAARTDTILHEMAHHWFGNLVTLKWWDGLWLNESFATWASHRARQELNPEQEVWPQFYRRDKAWAYGEDALETTHPVHQQAISTQSAIASFDAITYGKGAAALKQLVFWVGEEDFREGLKRYFSLYAYRNADLSDFIRKVAEASDTDLSTWSRDWLKNTGFDRFAVQWKCDLNGKLEELWVERVAGLRSRAHRTAVSLYRVPPQRGGAWRLIRKEEDGDTRSSRKRPRTTSTEVELPYSLETKITDLKQIVAEAKGFDCPDQVLINSQDQDYAQTQWSTQFLETFVRAPERVSDPLDRTRLWDDLWTAVEFKQISPDAFLKAVQTQLPREKDVEIVNQVLARLAPRRTAQLPEPGPLDFLTPNLRETWAKRLDLWARTQWKLFPANSDLRATWFLSALALAHDQPGKNWIVSLFNKQAPTGIDWSEERQWNALLHLSRLGGHPKLASWIEALRKKDPTDFGLRASVQVDAAKPDPENKKQIWTAMVARQAPFDHAANFEAAASVFLPSHATDREMWVEAVLAQIANWGNLGAPADQEQLAFTLVEGTIPAVCDQKHGTRLRQFLATHNELSPRIVKALKDSAQRSERCVLRPLDAPTETPVKAESKT